MTVVMILGVVGAGAGVDSVAVDDLRAKDQSQIGETCCYKHQHQRKVSVDAKRKKPYRINTIGREDRGNLELEEDGKKKSNNKIAFPFCK
jgi:hypothetical protein